MQIELDNKFVFEFGKASANVVVADIAIVKAQAVADEIKDFGGEGPLQ